MFVETESLKYYRAHVLTSTSARAGYDIITNNKIDVVISDIQMPEMSGWELIHAIRTHPSPAIRKMPVFAITSRVHPEDYPKLREAGYDHYFIKPTEHLELVSFISEYFKERSR